MKQTKENAVMKKNTELINGNVWYDTDGNVLHAHGGHMLFWQGEWYWYGENRTENRYVSVYRSRDLVNWTFCRHVLTTDSPTAEYRRKDQCGASQGAL